MSISIHSVATLFARFPSLPPFGEQLQRTGFTCAERSAGALRVRPDGPLARSRQAKGTQSHNQRH
jgi:hypothetical protein